MKCESSGGGGMGVRVSSPIFNYKSGKATRKYQLAMIVDSVSSLKKKYPSYFSKISIEGR